MPWRKEAPAALLPKIFFRSWGTGKSHRPRTVKCNLQPPQHCAPAHHPGISTCAQHTSPACLICRRFHRAAATCCSLGHHTPGYIACLPMLQRCSQHNLPPCPRCMVTRRGVRHCCGRGHHKVITHRKQTTRKRPPDNQGPPPKKRRVNSYRPHTLTGHARSPHTPNTPQPSKRRQAAPPPPIGGMGEDVDVPPRALFAQGHGGASTQHT